MTQPLFTLDAILAATGGRAEQVAAKSFDYITIDSREIGPESLFVAIKGDRFDGHDFVDAALANGAAAALVSRGEGPGRIIVPEALGGLVDIARAARARSEALIVGVTGSVGKTTTKEALRTVFEAAGETHASIKSFNNHWGVPLMLARMSETAQFGVFEMGMNAPDEIRPLSQLVRPHIAVITTIAPAHLEKLGSIEAIADAKAEIFEGLEPAGTALVNADHPQLGQLLEAAAEAGVGHVVTFGFARGADWQIIEPEMAGERSFATVVHGEDRYSLVISVAGRHMLSNATAALAAASLAGVEPAIALRALAGFGPQPGRGQRVLLGGGDKPLMLIDESYNANTASMIAALEVFASVSSPSGRKIVVLGDMLELGEAGRELHASLAGAVSGSGPDAVYLVGENMQHLQRALPQSMFSQHFTTVDEAQADLLATLAYGDAVMVKGSNGVGLSRLVAAMKDKFQQR
ncbi:UDP-N-acetylmuramoyl-tripeptide--D-alanyl-D-alanine ligase [Devosia crocina]|uniref:UDP-N-acetylmuramoyl-tripeptide--D-alanyl-D-alanine ligase n=1 Tax=Devosia crocina TaxID=429728 RepID=A0A1I7N6Y6_9HYPH|nr:UDP-N-acetylmuramoyl-tripeptide--D-alanyl-D-alanine ligase [Devosia crocina]SFV30414.1 UDP-N-acetylmuramoyl-tripeptide--D-alanyl-D-alanine ligase [Devosia crocina]